MLQFNELQRFIFVLHTVGDFSSEQIAKLIKTDSKIIDKALEAEKENVNYILQQTSKQDSTSYDKIVSTFVQNEKKVMISDKTDEKVMEIIDELSKSYESKKRIKNIIMGVAGLAVCACIIACIIQFTKVGNVTSGTDSGADGDDTGNGVVTVELDKSLTYYADILVQNYGTITIKLEEETAPVTVTNFVSLAQSGFYDGLTFHRIIEDFVMQGGDPAGDGTGGSQNTIVGEFSANGYENNLSHTRGAVSMARSSISYDSARSQFFIVHKDCSSSLDGNYAVFGYVTEGMEIVDAICEEAEPVDDNGLVATDKQPVITSIKIRTE